MLHPIFILKMDSSVKGGLSVSHTNILNIVQSRGRRRDQCPMSNKKGLTVNKFIKLSINQIDPKLNKWNILFLPNTLVNLVMLRQGRVIVYSVLYKMTV